MPLIAVLSLVLLFLGHSTLAGITGLIFALLFLAGFRHERRILVLWAVMTGFALAFFVPPGLFLPIRIGIASSIAMLVTKLVMLTLIPLSMAYNAFSIRSVSSCFLIITASCNQRTCGMIQLLAAAKSRLAMQ
mgnify:CR=1 FL=1